jgi:hypothetical protein
MAISDILATSGDGQDFVVEIPAGNAGYVPVDIVSETDGALLCVEIPLVTGGGGNVFIMSE